MLIYSNWVIFEEDHMKREVNELKGGNEKINYDIVRRAEDVRVFCRSFKFLTTEWTTDLPNPKNPNELDRFYVERVNGIFIDGVTLFLYHEFAHIILDHTNTYEVDRVTSILQEKEADEYAFEMYLNERNSKLEKFSAGLAVLFTFFSPFFVLAFPRNLQQDTHPDIDLRFQNALDRIGCEGNEERYSLYKLAVTLINDYLLSHKEALIQHGLEIPHR
jgi:hypothetical protein